MEVYFFIITKLNLWKFLRYFDYFITLVILANTVLLILQDYSYRIDSNEQDTQQAQILQTINDQSELVFSLIFVFEFILKIIGMGFVFEKGCYLRDGWNTLDFLVVISRY